jgi:glyoxylase-like metal-dependent hydrolase (beta-lactamase superfamily II)
MATVIELGHGVSVSQTALWETNSVLALGTHDAMLVDAGFEPAEIAALAARASSVGGTVHLLVTHADFDHTCGIGLLPDAVVVAGDATAGHIRSGGAGEQLAAAGAEWGLDWPSELRIDRVLAPGDHDVGSFAVSAFPAHGHTDDGLAFLLSEQGVLVTGDYLSPMTYPYVGASVAAAAATCRRLLEAVERHEPRWVVPGHGRPLPAGEARAVAQADLDYLEALGDAAREARERELPPGPALLHVFAVEPPRGTTADFEVYGIRASNARAALADA